MADKGEKSVLDETQQKKSSKRQKTSMSTSSSSGKTPSVMSPKLGQAQPAGDGDIVAVAEPVNGNIVADGTGSAGGSQIGP